MAVPVVPEYVGLVEMMWRKYARVLYDEKLREMNLTIDPDRVVDTSMTIERLRGLNLGSAESIDYVKRDFERQFAQSPAIYWWPWSELWKGAV